MKLALGIVEYTFLFAPVKPINKGSNNDDGAGKLIPRAIDS